MRASWLIALKDLRQRVRDRSAILLALVLPLALAAIFDLVFGSAATPRPFQYAVVDLDRGQLAAVFVEETLLPLQSEGVVTLQRVDTRSEGEALVTSGRVDATFVLPRGFSVAVRAQAPAGIEVIGNVDSPTGSAVARSLASSYVAELKSVRVAVAAVAAQRPLSHQQVEQAAQRAVAVTRPVRLDDISAASKVLDATTYFAAGMAVFFLFFTVQFGVASLLDERATGTLPRLLAAPIPRGAVLAGKLASSVLLGLVSMTVLVVATSVLLGASWGNPFGVALLVLSGVLAATGITAVVASLARTADQAGNAQAVIAVVLGMLGGVFFPISQIGGFTTALSLATPHAWFMRGLGELAGGGGVIAVLPAVAAMLGFATVTGALAALRLGKVVRL
ncbi:MAG TPA: ABC transporter permease [Micromonosporaceae bacterium]